MTLIIILVIALASATVVEGIGGRAAVEHYVYRSVWFVSLFVLLSVNILCAVLVRFPWPRHQLGFVITHAGLLALLAGMMQSMIDAVEGRMVLEPGRECNTIELVNRSELRIRGMDRDPARQNTFAFPNVPLEVTLNAFGALKPNSRVAVRVVEFRPAMSQQSATAELRKQSRNGTDAAALVELSADDCEQRVWLERDGVGKIIEMPDGPLLVELCSRQLALGFSVQWLESRHVTNLGGYGDASFGSTIRLLDDHNSRPLDAEIAVNRPAAHKGFRFVQVDFQRTADGKHAVIMSVTRDAGWLLKYAGVATVCLGMAMTLLRRVRDPFSAAEAGDGAPHRSTSQSETRE